MTPNLTPKSPGTPPAKHLNQTPMDGERYFDRLSWGVPPRPDAEIFVDGNELSEILVEAVNAGIITAKQRAAILRQQNAGAVPDTYCSSGSSRSTT